jgi:hypothetical protein
MRGPIRIACACALSLALGGCGTAGGVSKGALLTVYVSAPLHGAGASAGKAMCAGARGELARRGAHLGSLRVRAICLDDTGGGARWSLAAVGADARHASEDSSTVGYIGELDPAASRFSRPILAGAGIAQLPGPSGRAAMATLLAAIRSTGGSGEVREAVLARLDRG